MEKLELSESGEKGRGVGKFL